MFLPPFPAMAYQSVMLYLCPHALHEKATRPAPFGLAFLGITDKFSHPSSHICAVLSSSTNPRRSTATPVVCLLAEPSKSQVRRTQAIGQRLVCENVPRMQARSAPHDWLTLTAIDTAHLCKSGRLHFISVSFMQLNRRNTAVTKIPEWLMQTYRIGGIAS